VLFVPSTVPGEPEVDSRTISLKTALMLLAEPRVRGLAIAGFALGLVTISDSIIFLVLQRRLGIGVMAFPLLYVGTSPFTSASLRAQQYACGTPCLTARGRTVTP
jgi:hypothetical protein